MTSFLTLAQFFLAGLFLGVDFLEGVDFFATRLEGLFLVRALTALTLVAAFLSLFAAGDFLGVDFLGEPGRTSLGPLPGTGGQVYDG